MKITTFNPQIISKDAKPLVKLFEELGFTQRHHQENIGELNVTGIRMMDTSGFYMDISQADSPAPQDLVSIRMNVDNFDEAYQLLTKHGFKNFYDDKTADTKTSKSAVMISPTGFTINLIEHLK